MKTTAEAAKRLKRSRQRVTWLCQQGTLPATKVGRDWLIDEVDLEQFAATVRKPGRPRNRPADGQGE